MKRQIKLMPDYQCWPLWWAGAHEPGNIDPASLALSAALISKLGAWAQRFDAQMNFEDPSLAMPLLGQALEDFEVEGQQLWQQLCVELGNAYTVTYFSISKQRVITAWTCESFA